ncbi:nucleoside/nucleotide kinase family protein [Luteococcus sp. Sow4_B9]|uniref:nucleoside/nucleotide kinase family protein n=1 Tax=Luteococcus sp. Sow4_B9 TaxID=3438792 RepID=UPI003F9DFA28
MQLDALSAIHRARQLVQARSGRVIVGIAGAPGAGKSHLAEEIRRAIPGTVVVGMDGFHLAHSVLLERGRAEAKGAPETFDAHGYVALLERIRAHGPDPVWAPEFRRDVEDAIAGAVEVPASARLVVTEGNYLLLPQAPWSRIPALCDEVWFVAPDEQVRVQQLIRRHVEHGRDEETARARALTGTDGVNAKLVQATGHRADAQVRR